MKNYTEFEADTIDTVPAVAPPSINNPKAVFNVPAFALIFG